MKTIQMIPVSEDNSLFILDYNEENAVITFKVSLKPDYVQKEQIVINTDKVYTNLFFFHISYLQKFLYENEEN